MLLEANKIPIAYRAPFAFDGPCYVDERPPGESILDMVRTVPDLPRNFLQLGTVCINGEVVPNEYWSHVRPKPANAELPIAVTLHYPLRNPGGGGGGTLKTVGAIVGAIALIIVTQGIAAGALPYLFGAGAFGGYFAAGSVSAALLAGAVGIAGALAISALTAPPVSAAGTDIGQTNADQAEAAAASGNVLERGGAIPRVIGTRKVFPPLACEPVVELIDQDEQIEALFILNGPHALNEIRIEGNPIADAEDVEYETREGWSTDTMVESIQRQGRTTAPQIELSQHSLDTNGAALLHQSLPESDLPVWHGVSSRSSPDEIWLHILWPGGIYIGSNNAGAVPLRIRMRKRGDTAWINLPEIHLAWNSTDQLRTAILFKWATAGTMLEPPANVGFYYAHLNPPGQSNAPATPTDRLWVAHSHFDSGAGNDYVFNGNAASTAIRNLHLFKNQVIAYLDEGTFPKGIYEIQIKRGSIIFTSSFTKTTYQYTPGPYIADFFWYLGTSPANIQQSHANVSDRCILTRVISIWNDPPISVAGDFSLIAIKALNRSIRQVSVIASGYVRDWDGSGWNTWATTSNPAPHYADVLSGSLNADALPADLRDDTALTAWRTLCINNNWTCDAIVNDTRTQDVLALLASCGYARPYQSDVYGVIVDNDRSADSPMQIFSRRNCANLRYERSFARVPAGFNVTYRDEAVDDDQAQVTVYQRDPTNSDLTLLESVSYDGLIDVDKVIARALFDLDQANLRATFYYLTADIESLVCRRGSLVGVEHDVLMDRSGDGYIVSKQTSAGNITGVTLDAEIPITNAVDMHAVTDLHTITNMHDVGVQTGIVIRRTDGSLSTHQLSNVTGSANVLTFSTPFTDTALIQGFNDNDRKYGCLIVAGRIGSIYRRLLVQFIQPQKDLTATLVLVDEAPELVRFS